MLRRRRVIVLVVVVLGAAIGVAGAVSREETYTAAASLSFRDVSQDLSLFGVDTLPEQPAAIRAAVNAELVTRTEVTRRVAKEFDGELTPAQLASAVSARVGARTQLVALEATAAESALAARIANEYAEKAVALGEAEVDNRLKEVEASLIEELTRLESGPASARQGIGIRISVLESQLSRVQTLRDIAVPVEIARAATPPGSPDSPDPVTAGVAGGILGLILGLAAAFTRDALDRRLRNAEDVHSELGLPIVGRVSEGAMGYPGLARRDGLTPMPDEDFEAFRVLRANLGFMAQEHEIRTILVASSRPDEGKTTVSMGLASAAALAGSRVLLLEGDMRRPCFAERLRVNTGPGLAEYLRGEAEPSDVVQVVELTDPTSTVGSEPPSVPAKTTGSQLACITAGRAPGDAAELLASDRFTAFMAEVEEAYDLVVVDTSPMLSVVDPLELIARVDAALICARAHQTTRDELRAAQAALGNLPDRTYGAVITGLRRDGPDSYAYYYGY